jgi:hypothetical protein
MKLKLALIIEVEQFEDRETAERYTIDGIRGAVYCRHRLALTR